MEKRIEYFIADAAGNITAFVTTNTEREEYIRIGKHLMALPDERVEQVAFIKRMDLDRAEKIYGEIEMCGLEFCGNAARSFGLYMAKTAGIEGESSISLRVSGCDEELYGIVNTQTNHGGVNLPLPKEVFKIAVKNIPDWDDSAGISDVTMVDMEGIIHSILFDVTATDKRFEIIKNYIMTEHSPPALGVMFLDSKNLKLVPVVYVRDADTVYYEGSCGSGSAASAAALAMEKVDGQFSYNIEQPAGTIMTNITKEKGHILKISIEGPISLGSLKSIYI